MQCGCNSAPLSHLGGGGGTRSPPRPSQLTGISVQPRELLGHAPGCKYPRSALGQFRFCQKL
jgi:hypothetical protein